MRKRRMVLCGALALVVLSGRAVSLTRTVELDYSIEDLSFDRTLGYDLVRLEGADLLGDPGEPFLPRMSMHVSIPEGMEVTGIDVKIAEVDEIPGTYRIFPAQEPLPLSRADETPEFTGPDAGIYGSHEAFPRKVVESFTSGRKAGHYIASFLVSPLRYIGATGSLTLIRRLLVTLSLNPSSRPLRAVERRSSAVERMISERIRWMVVNPEDVPERVARGIAGPDSRTDLVEYLIITHDSYVSHFQPLADWKTEKGVPTEIVTRDWVYANYPGDSDQEQIRNCIADYELNQGTIWVLLGGDVDVIPFRGCYGKVGGTSDNGIPCDLFYSELDEDWNADGDSRWGEVADIGINMYPDVYVGRAPVDNTSEVDIFVTKVLTYEFPTVTDYMEDALFMAEYLDEYTNSAAMKNQIDTESFPSDFDPILKLYESSGNLYHSAAVNALDEGKNLINHSGHGNTSVMSIGPDALYNSDMYDLDNAPRYGIYYTLGCYCGNFESTCILEKFVHAPNGGGFAIGNSRYGWYSPGNPGEGSSDKYDRRFWHVVFNENRTSIGEAFAESKADYAIQCGSNNSMRWCQFCLNLLGDPEMPIWTGTPMGLDVSYPDSLPLGSGNFTVTVEEGRAPIEDARVCIYKADENLYDYGFTGPNGQVNFVLNPTLLGEMLVTVTYPGYMPHQGTSTVTGLVSPVADFAGEPLQGYAPLSVQFTDLTYGTVENWLWSFDDGDTSSVQNPLHIFELPGLYDVTLVVSGAAGSDTAVKSAFVEAIDPDSAWLSSSANGYPKSSEITIGSGSESAVNLIMEIVSDTAHAVMFPLCYDLEHLALGEVVFDTSTFPGGREGAWNFFERDTVMNDSGKLMLYAWTASYSSGVPVGVHRIGSATFTGIDTGECIIDTCWYPPQGHLSYGHGPTGSDYWPRWQSVSVSVVNDLCGDANGDLGITSGDGYFILNYFGAGPAPVSCWAANVNGDGGLTTGDGYHLLNWFGGGPALDCAPCSVAMPGERMPAVD
jgi:hypothetical protein